MENRKKLIVLSSLAKDIVGVSLLVFILVSFQHEKKVIVGDKVTLCHLPPGNPTNHHLISVSVNAAASHLVHGDKVVCYRVEELDGLMLLVGGDESKIIKIWELKDANPANCCNYINY